MEEGAVNVELAPEAERKLRRLPDEARRGIAHKLDALAGGWLPERLGGEPPEDGDIVPVGAGGYIIFCEARDAGDRLLVVTIASASDSSEDSVAGRVAKRAGRSLERSLPWSRSRGVSRGLRTRRTLGDFLAEAAADARLAIRGFRRSPGFFLVTTLVLALGLGANTAVFSVVNNVFLASLPFPDGDRMLRLKDGLPSRGGQVLAVNMTARNFSAIREQARSLDRVVAQDPESGTLFSDDEPLRVSTIGVTEGWSELIGVQPVAGRTFTDQEHRLGGDARVVLMAHALWMDRYGADPNIVGDAVELDGRPHTVVGVMPPRFRYPYTADFWTPMRVDPSDGTNHDLNVVALPASGIGAAQVRGELDRIAQRLQEQHGDTNQGVSLVAVLARDDFIQDQDRVILALSGSVAFLLLIACLNVANLLVARFLGRQREIGIRAALGAGRFRQARRFMVETVLLFLAGGLGGVVLTSLVSDFLTTLVPSVLRTQLDLGDLSPGWTVLAFALALALALGALFGLVAGLRGARPDLQGLLKEGGRAEVGHGRGRLQSVLVSGEIALAMVLLVGAGLMAEHLRRLQAGDLGFQAEGLVTLRVDLETEEYQDPDVRRTLVRRITDVARSVPGVEEAAITTVNPICCGDWGARVEIEGVRTGAEDPSVMIHHRYATAGIHEAMGIPLVRGRTFTEQDGADGRPVVIVDERLAQRYWPDEDPIGKRVRWSRAGQDTPWFEVVGVVGGVRDAGDYTETWYLPYELEPMGRSARHLHVMARTRDGSGGATQVGRAVHEAILERVDGDLAVYGIAEMDDLWTEAISQDRLGTTVIVFFGALGVLLAGLGIYGIMSHFVGRKKREVGTRMALGASGREVVRLIMLQSLRLVAAGAVVGVGGSLVLERVLRSVIPGVPELDLVLVLGVGATLTVMAVLATWIPAARAAAVQPATAFRG